MDQLDYAKIIKDIIVSYAQDKPYNVKILSRCAFDDKHNSYALLQAGWDKDKYIHGALIHVDIIEGKIWIQYDGTEDGIVDELIAAGIPANRIVLGFRPPKIRPYTGFATS